MAHKRNRHLAEIIKKRLLFSPVVSIQGVRQSGKSFLVREILATEGDSSRFSYITFDQLQLRQEAKRTPDSFLVRYTTDTKTLIIDEAQKVPEIFDAIKFAVDKNRIPGKFIVLGSTEFSRQTLVRESLTGRISRTRLFPLTLAEAHNLSLRKDFFAPQLFKEKPRIERKELLRHLERGGFPGIFSIREKENHRQALNDWLETTCWRDMAQFPKIKTDGQLAYDILATVAKLEEPTAANLSKTLSQDLRIIKKHLDLLVTLFALHPISPFTESTGNTRYFLCDSGLAMNLGSSIKRALETQMIVEALAYFHSTPDNLPHLQFYKAQKSASIPLIIENEKSVSAFQVFDSEHFNSKDFNRLNGFWQKIKNNKTYKNKTIRLVALTSSEKPYKENNIEIFPWEYLA